MKQLVCYIIIIVFGCNIITQAQSKSPKYSSSVNEVMSTETLEVSDSIDVYRYEFKNIFERTVAEMDFPIVYFVGFAYVGAYIDSETWLINYNFIVDNTFLDNLSEEQINYSAIKIIDSFDNIGQNVLNAIAECGIGIKFNYISDIAEKSIVYSPERLLKTKQNIIEGKIKRPSFLQCIIEEIDKVEFPIRFSNNLEWIRCNVDTQAKIIYYKYRFNRPIEDTNFISQSLIDSIKNELITNLNTYKIEICNEGITLKYIYLDEYNNTLFEIQITGKDF